MSKTCSKCLKTLHLEAFSPQPSAATGRHSWCKACCNQYARENRQKERGYTPEQRRRWSLTTRYGMTETQWVQLLASQRSLCAICGQSMKRICVDHDHATNKVRGLLCHSCNVKLAAIENRAFFTAATAYLEKHGAT